LKVAVVTTNEVYDEFGFGAESPLAIRAFIDWAYRQWASPAPRFVLLVGKASYDYLDYLNGPKCPNCGSKIDYGVTTEYSDELECHICLSCGQVLK
jgi:hypothetical protein